MNTNSYLKGSDVVQDLFIYLPLLAGMLFEPWVFERLSSRVTLGYINADHLLN